MSYSQDLPEICLKEAVDMPDKYALGMFEIYLRYDLYISNMWLRYGQEMPNICMRLV